MKKYVFLLVICLLAGCNLPVSPTFPTTEVQSTSTLAPSLTPQPTFTLAPTATPLLTETVTYYLLRIEYSTTSDWSTVDLSMGENVLAVKIVEVQGSPTNPEAGTQRLGLGQSLTDAEKGKRVGMVVEYAIAPEALGQTLKLHSQKGDIGSNTISVYSMENGEPKLIQSFKQSGIVANSRGLNPRTFSVDLASLQNTTQMTAEIQRVPSQKMVWAFYYMWYSAGDWNSPSLKDYPLVLYDSSNSKTITRHVEQAQSAGIDGFISSW